LKRLESAQTPAEARALRLLRALGSPVRLRIVEIAPCARTCTGPQLAEELGLAQSSLFEHLTALREAGLIEVSGEGPNRYYGLDPSVLDSLAAYLAGSAPNAHLGPAGRHVTGRRGNRIRDARLDDAPAIARIYNRASRIAPQTLETELRSPEERAEWLAAHDGRIRCSWPWTQAGVAVRLGLAQPLQMRAPPTTM